MPDSFLLSAAAQAALLIGGLAVDEFKRRQRLHREAEICAMRDVGEFIEKAHTIYGYDHFINDAGGSVVELDDEIPGRLQVAA